MATNQNQSLAVSQAAGALAEKKGRKKVDKIEVVRHGDALIIPEDMSLDDVLKVVALKREEEETITSFSAEIPASPYDGGYALARALEDMFGVKIARATQILWFTIPPQMITVDIDAKGNTVQVPWGEFQVPGIDGRIETSYTFRDGRVVFMIQATIKQKHKRQFDKLVLMVKEILASSSIYKGKAFRVNFTNDAGKIERMPTIKFIDVDRVTRPIFTKLLEDQMEYDVLAYIRQSEAIKKMQGGVLKRGVLLAGPYGTGKTLSANYIAKVAQEHGFTFVYTKAADIPYAIDFARSYLPAVVFAEDIDSVVTKERTDDVNRLLNKIDGIDSKRQDILFVATTNHPNDINAALLRPGRIDVVMLVEAPDAEAAIRVARWYASGEGTLEAGMEGDDRAFREAGKLLAGMIPATIQEVVRRAQVRAFARTDGASSVITNADLVNAAQYVIREHNLTNPTDEKVDPVKKLGTAFGEGVGSAIGRAMRDVMGMQNARIIQGALPLEIQPMLEAGISASTNSAGHDPDEDDEDEAEEEGDEG